jgi:hypothetical protein
MKSEPEQTERPAPAGSVPTMEWAEHLVGPPLPNAPQAGRRIWLRSVVPIAVFALLVAGGIYTALQRDAILDWLFTRGYHPTAQMSQITSDDRLTAYGKRLLYVNRPLIEGQKSFNEHCTNASDQVVVLGCYTGNRQGIYLYNVTDARLSGIEQVTAAHEMLHQAYDRLGSSERAHIDRLLSAYESQVTDQDIKDQLAAYRKTEPNQVLNEMHSLFGTEVANLPPELEQYYSRYFQDRSKIVAYQQQYMIAFTQRRQQIAAYDAQLDSLKAQIDQKRIKITAEEKTIQTQRTQLNAYLSANQIAAYNAAVPGFNVQVDIYRADIVAANKLVDQYNSIIDQRNAIAIQEQQLQQAINSHASTAPSK